MIACAIERYLEKSGITLSYLSDKTGMTCGCIGCALEGKRQFSIEEYVKICTALELPYDYFFVKARESAVHNA